jgi:hypothetical protein
MNVLGNCQIESKWSGEKKSFYKMEICLHIHEMKWKYMICMCKYIYLYERVKWKDTKILEH